MSTTTPPTRWTRIRMGRYTTWYRVGMYNMLIVATGKRGRWTWRIVDQASGCTVFAGTNALLRRRYYRTFKEAKRVAWSVMLGMSARWTDNLYSNARMLKYLVKSDYFFPEEEEAALKDIEFMRAQARHRMIVERGGKHAVCDLCGQKPDYRGLQLHELIQRGMTVHNSPARALSYEPEMTALLCADCHSRAHNPEVRDKLWQVNYKRYGVERVKKAFLRFQVAYTRHGSTLDVALPVPEAQQGARIARARPPPEPTATAQVLIGPVASTPVNVDPIGDRNVQ